MIVGLTAFKDEKGENNEEGGESLSVFDVDDRLEVLANEQLADEDESYIQQRPQRAKSCRLDVFDGVETDEYDEREICVERVGDEKGNEADRPGESGITAVHL